VRAKGEGGGGRARCGQGGSKGGKQRRPRRCTGEKKATHIVVVVHDVAILVHLVLVFFIRLWLLVRRDRCVEVLRKIKQRFRTYLAIKGRVGPPLHVAPLRTSSSRFMLVDTWLSIRSRRPLSLRRRGYTASLASIRL
jgi:hypothetical protein